MNLKNLVDLNKDGGQTQRLLIKKLCVLLFKAEQAINIKSNERYRSWILEKF